MLLQLKHSPGAIENILLQREDIKIIVPIRNFIDAMVSGCIYNPDKLNKKVILQETIKYKRYLELKFYKNVRFVDFELFSRQSPLQLASLIGKKTGHSFSFKQSDEYLLKNMKNQDMFMYGKFGDSTGYTAEESIQYPLKFHMPNDMKKELKKQIKPHVTQCLSSEILRELENGRISVLQ